MNGLKNEIRAVLYEAPGPKTRRTTNIVTAVSVILLALLAVLVVRRFYVTGQLDIKYWEFFGKITTWTFLGDGLLGTLEAALISAALAFVLGFLIMAGRISGFKPLSALCAAVTEFTRGVPTLLFIYFFFLVIPTLGIDLAPVLKISLPVTLSACGVVAEVFRTGVNAVPKGQREAAVSLGLSRIQVFLKIVFPQAFRYVIPTLIAELVIVLKDTTFAYVVSFPDIMQNARVLISNYDAMLSVYLVVSVIYILINYLINRLSVKLAERQGRR